MSPHNGLAPDVLNGAGSAPRTRGWQSWRHCGFMGAMTAVLLALATPPAALGGGGQVKLARKYHAGQVMVYTTEVRTRGHVESHPEALKNFFPPVPPELTMRQQNTVTVTSVHPDGAADIQHRIDHFEVQTDLSTVPDNLRDAARQAQQEFTEHMTGQMMTVHYDHDGRLVDFEGADAMLKELDPPLREPLRQMMRLFLEQMGGQSLYPDHPIKPGEEWAQKLDSPPRPDYPFQEQGKSTLHYSGKTRYHGVKAAIVDYHFENSLIPGEKGLEAGGAMSALDAMGARLDIHISGKGEGRILVALDDGRVLQNHSILHQTLSALMKGKEGLLEAGDQIPKLEIQADTDLQVEGAGK
jgi:hypothetical protein